MQRKVYILENLDCANCAAKIERKLSKLPELSDVSVTFATKQLRFAAEDPEAVLPKIRETIQSMEPDVEVVERTRSRRKAAETHNHEHHHHEHGEECGCGHDHHDHDHDHEEHEHHHDHDHEHEHHHDHGEGCTCGCHDHDHEHPHHHADDVFTSWGKETPHIFERATIENALKAFAETEDYGTVIRSKGMVQSTDGTWIYFDLVDGEYELRTGEPDYTGRLVVIGTDIDEHQLEELFGIA